MEISYGLVNLMYFMLCDELNGIKGSRSNKRRKLLTCFTNSLFKVYNNLSLRETGPRYITVVVTPMELAPLERDVRKRMDFVVRSKSLNSGARSVILMMWSMPLGSGPAVSPTIVIIMRIPISCPW